jgi:hypothetical protein
MGLRPASNCRTFLILDSCLKDVSELWSRLWLGDVEFNVGHADDCAVLFEMREGAAPGMREPEGCRAQRPYQGVRIYEVVRLPRGCAHPSGYALPTRLCVIRLHSAEQEACVYSAESEGV